MSIENKKKETFEEPTCEFVEFEIEDIILTSLDRNELEDDIFSIH